MRLKVMNESARHLCDKPLQVKASCRQIPRWGRMPPVLIWCYNKYSICNWDGLEEKIYMDQFYFLSFHFSWLQGNSEKEKTAFGDWHRSSNQNVSTLKRGLLVATINFCQVRFLIINWFLKGLRCLGKAVGILMAFTFSKVYPRLCVRLERGQLSFVWIAGYTRQSNKNALGWLCFWGRLTVADGLPQTGWQVPSSIHSTSQTFDSLVNKMAVWW